MFNVAKSAMDHFGRIDVLINNAGTMPLAFFADHRKAVASWDKCIDVNIKGVMYGIMAVHDQMIEQGRGHIVNLSSIFGNFPVEGGGVYAATKAAVNFLSASLRVETQGKIKVTVVRPTGVPATGLSGGVINGQSAVGIMGQNAEKYSAQMQSFEAGDLPPECIDPDSVQYLFLEPEYLAEQIIYTINQPWGVSISDITVRASGDRYVL
jgi:NADP-dependent 3-hydroxy acid dehydrogenase YdfG